MSARMRPVPRGVRQAVLDSSTIRDFSGGWNVIDSQLNMKSKFQPVLDNMVRLDDGSLGIRYGTTEFVGEEDFIAANPEVIQVPQGDGDVIGTGTNLDAAFDGTQNPPTASCAQGDRTYLDVGKHFTLAARPVFAAAVYPNDVGSFFSTGSGTIELRLEASQDNATWSILDTATLESDGVPLDGVFLQWTNAPAHVPEADNYTGPYFYMRVVMEKLSGTNNTTLLIGEVEFFELTEGTPETETGWLVNMIVFQSHVICVFSSGKIYKVAPDETVTIIWSDEIAALLPGGPSGWSTNVDFVSFTTFNNQLIVGNGIDKPLLIDLTATTATDVDYLQDLATGSNANVPIARYALAINEFVLWAGDPLFPGRVHVSNQGTSGTYVGDAEPNNAVYIDIDKVAAVTESTIRGLARFRKQAVVAFDKESVVGTLGIFDDTGNHSPDFSDVVPGHGSISHRSMIDLGNDLLMCDYVGVPSLRRGTFTGEAEPTRTSELIDPEIQQMLGHLRIDTTTKHVHAVYNPLERQYILFVPNHNPDEDPEPLPADPLIAAEPGTGRLYVSFLNPHHYMVGDRVTLANATAFNEFTAEQLNATHKIVAIPEARTGQYVEVVIDGVEANSDSDDQVGGGASATAQGHATETVGFVYSVIDTLKIKAWARFRGWRWSCATVTDLSRVLFSDGVGVYVYGSRDFPSSKDFIDSGASAPIEWAWETPWVDFDKRMNNKHTRYMALDTVGYAQFSAMMFVDQIYRDADARLDPQLRMEMEGGSTGGYGRGAQPYGGGRRTSTERMYAWTAKFKIAKLRFEGSTTESLRFVSVSLAYQRGSIRR